MPDHIEISGLSEASEVDTGDDHHAVGDETYGANGVNAAIISAPKLPDPVTQLAEAMETDGVWSRGPDRKSVV